MFPSTVAESEIASIRIPIPGRNHKTIHWTFSGYSRAGVATAFFLSEPKWLFDCGCIVTHQRPSCIFLTHTHSDHIQALPQLLFSHRNSPDSAVSIIHVYFPAPAEHALRSFLQSYDSLIRDEDEEASSFSEQTMEAQYCFCLCPVRIQDDAHILPSSTRQTQYSVRIVECQHRKVCYGYSFWQRHWVPSPPWDALSGPELGAEMKKRAGAGGEGIPYQWSTPPQPLFCYLGDSTTQVFALHPELLQEHRMIVLECTYYHTEHSGLDESSNPAQHTYWPVLQRIVQDHPQVLFLLQHFSVRHRPREWLAWMKEYNQGGGHGNVHALLPSALDNDEATRCICFLCRPTETSWTTRL